MVLTMELNEQIIKTWLDAINEWTSVGLTGKYIVDMTTAAEDLRHLLSELKKVLIKLEPREVLSRFPSVPKFLHALLSNVMVQTTEDLHRLVLQCVSAVAVSFQQHGDEIHEKSIKWVKSQIKSVCQSYPAVINSSVNIAEHFGLQPVDITGQLNNELVTSLVEDLSNAAYCHGWSDLHRQFIPRYPIRGNTLRSISEMCLPILTKPVVRPLVEALLCCEAATDVITNSTKDVTTDQALSPHFLNALKDNPKDCYLGIPLTYDARVSLWLHDHLYFEEEIISLLEICCFERKYMSREEMRKVVSLREVPKALGEITSLFSVTYQIILRVIYETSGDLYVLKFVGLLFQLMSKNQQQKYKTPFAETFKINYANIWSVEMSNFVNLLTVDWADMAAKRFFHHAENVKDRINEICWRTESPGCQLYYIWLILQGFQNLSQRCCWVVLFADQQFVGTCLTILSCCHGGGTAFDDKAKMKLNNSVDILRRLRNKNEIMTSDILCVLDGIVDPTNCRPNVAIIIRYLVTLFMLISCSLNNLDIQAIIFKLSVDLSLPNAFDQLLDVVEETIRFQKCAQSWISVNFRLDALLINSFILLDAIRTNFDEYVRQHSEKDTQNEIGMVNDIRSRYDTLYEILRVEKG
ncbi:uncharacterized protein LOC114526229 isoform X2 [Dendronephthya gigantea]|uniref:uncharacterized protein LOC114526229 isoform X2 n=1 Tax=Dendronephthya gigantea TaxID=151771 RepID=UPI00106A016C|nr:uncharacterized protein LOC114526229 isoform X2 [Dendronephthya gigantea]